MSGKLISFGVAAAIGVLLAIAYYELKPANDSLMTSTDFANAIATGSQEPDSPPYVSSDIELPGVTGTVGVYKEKELTVLRIRMESDDPVGIHGTLENTDIDFIGVSNQSTDTVEGFIFARGNFSITGSTKKDVTIIISVPEGSENMPSNDLRLAVTREREVIFRETLSL